MCDIAWLAGLIEGEGSYTLGEWTRGEQQNMKIGVKVILYNTDAQIIRKAKDVLDAHGITYHIRERELKPMLRPGGGEYQPSAPMLIVTISRLASVEKLVSLLEPWTFGEKRHRLLLIREYVSKRVAKIAHAGGHPKSAPIDDEDRDCLARFKKLRRRRDASTTGCEGAQAQGTV